MKNEPWVRFGIRMRPKISEKPADRRKRRPPSVMLFTASTSVRLTGGALSRGRRRRSALERWIVALVHRLREEPLLVVRPELAHVLVRLDRGVDELVALPLAAADVERADDVAEMVEAERAARRIGERYGPQRLDERILVLGLAAGLLEGSLGHHAVDVNAGRVDARNVAVVLHHALDEALVAGRVQTG